MASYTCCTMGFHACDGQGDLYAVGRRDLCAVARRDLYALRPEARSKAGCVHSDSLGGICMLRSGGTMPETGVVGKYFIAWCVVQYTINY